MRSVKYFSNTEHLQSFLDAAPRENIPCVSDLRTGKLFKFRFTCMKITSGLRISPESIIPKGTSLTELLGSVNDG